MQNDAILAEAMRQQALAAVFAAAYQAHVAKGDAGPTSRAADAVHMFKTRCL